MYLTFAWRYFRAKKSASAVNIIAWLSVIIIAIASCAQVLVLSVFNGFEDLVKSLYASFYSDVKILPTTGKTFVLTDAQIKTIQGLQDVALLSLIVEEKALLKNEATQKAIILKGVDENYINVNSITNKITTGTFNIGTAELPKLVVGQGVQNAAGISLNDALPASVITLILPKKTTSTNADEAISTGNTYTTGVFGIQQEIDDKYALTNIYFLQHQIGLAPNEYSAVEIKLRPKTNIKSSKKALENLLGKNFVVQTRYEQNANLYNTMRLEKWAVYLVLTLIIIIASFNIISVLTMLVLEKQKDISILRSMGTSQWGIQKIFLAEGLLLGSIGATIGISLALLICFLQIKLELIKIQGGSFLIDYFPVKVLYTDVLLIIFTIIIISIVAAWFPSNKAAGRVVGLK